MKEWMNDRLQSEWIKESSPQEPEVHCVRTDAASSQVKMGEAWTAESLGEPTYYIKDALEHIHMLPHMPGHKIQMQGLAGREAPIQDPCI